MVGATVEVTHPMLYAVHKFSFSLLDTGLLSLCVTSI